MNKFSVIFAVLAFSFVTKAQNSENLIPKDAVTVFSLNNIAIFEKVAMDELVSYDFMSAVQSELFDGSTSGKNIKDAGFNFKQKINIFYGKNDRYELSGFTFGIENKTELFTVFDDFDRKETQIPGVEYYNNYFNHLFIQNNIGLLIRVDAHQAKTSEIIDSIWMARGYDFPWNEDPYLEEEYQDEENFTDEEVEESSEMEEITEGSKVDDLHSYYFQLRDSLEAELAEQYLFAIVDDLFISKNSLASADERFTEQLMHTSDAVFYMDNGRNVTNTQRLGYLQMMFPDLHKDLKELYSGNVLLGDLFLREKSIDIEMNANYGEALGSIYSELNDSKFDKKVLKYIPKNNEGFFTYNIDLRKGYERAFDILIPLLREEKNPRISANVLIIELLNEFVNKDKVFNTYKGSMFGTFNGIKKVKTKKIDFFYDEITFEYGEKEVEIEENMPVFTLGFSTASPDVPTKILNHMARLTSQFKNMGEYWVYEDAILGSLPLYMIIKNDLFIFTNDEDLAKNHSDGYGKNIISKTEQKNAKKSGSMYAFFNSGAIITELPKEMFTEESNTLIESMRGKEGLIHVTSSETSKSKTNYKMHYDFDAS